MRRFARQVRVGEESENPDPVFDDREDNAVSDESGPIVKRIGAPGPGDVGAAVDPDHHGQPGGRLAGRSPDIEIQAVFAAGGGKLIVPPK